MHDQRTCFLKRPWYTEFEPMRNAYFRVRWVAKGERPFQSDRAPSSLMTVLPQWYMPLYLPVVRCASANSVADGVTVATV
jgi:hypothetical protein